MKVKCPTCQTEKEWSSLNPHRPFCCERCKLIDLGEWASEQHKIAGQPDPKVMESMSDEELFALMANLQANPEQE